MQEKLRHWLQPDAFCEGFDQLDIEALEKAGIRLLACDVDNTLIDQATGELSAMAAERIEQLRCRGIELVLMSNNFSGKGAARLPQARAYLFACKPFLHTFHKICRQSGYSAGQSAIFGDQLLTDILGGRRAGFYTILNTKKPSRMRLDQKIIRFVETRYLFDYRRQHE